MTNTQTDTSGQQTSAHTPQVSIVILNYNKHDDLVRNLTRLREISYPNLEVIIVDNCSTDGSRAMVRNTFPEFQLIEAPFNGGVSIGRNLGFRAAHGEFIIYLDDDAVAPVDIVEKTLALFQSDPEIGCLAYLIRQMPQDFLCNDHDRKWIVNYHGAGHALRTDALRKIDFLDEGFFFGGEEIDSTLRLMEAGYKTRHTPEIIVDHYAIKRSGTEYARRTSNWIASWAWFYFKHFPLHLAIACASRVWGDTTLQALRRGVMSVPFISFWYTLKGLPKIWRVRSIASPETIDFYMDPDSEPPHYNRSVLRKVFRSLRWQKTN